MEMLTIMLLPQPLDFSDIPVQFVYQNMFWTTTNNGYPWIFDYIFRDKKACNRIYVRISMWKWLRDWHMGVANILKGQNTYVSGRELDSTLTIVIRKWNVMIAFLELSTLKKIELHVHYFGKWKRKCSSSSTTRV